MSLLVNLVGTPSQECGSKSRWVLVSEVAQTHTQTHTQTQTHRHRHTDTDTHTHTTDLLGGHALDLIKAAGLGEGTGGVRTITGSQLAV